MKHGIGRKLLSVVLAVMMLVSLLPTAAFAEDVSNSAETTTVNEGVGSADPKKGGEDGSEGTNVGNDGDDVGTNPDAKAVNNSSVDEGEGEEVSVENADSKTSTSFDVSSGNVYIVAENGKSYTISGTTTTNTVTVTLASGTATVVLSDVSITSSTSNAPCFKLDVAQSATLYLELDGTNLIKLTDKDTSAAAVHKIGAGKLVICDENTVAGSLTAETVGFGAAIGGGNYSDEQGTIGDIEISGGTVTASAKYGAAIGTGCEHSIMGSLVISGGVVNATAYSSTYAAAIGSGQYGTVDTILISGGKVTATAGYGAGIGSGAGSTSTKSTVNTISITNGDIIAESTRGGAGIGGGSGKSATVGSITISGGKVTATSSTYQNTTGAAIGGAKGTVDSIAISGGDVTLQYKYSGKTQPGTIGVNNGMAEGSVTIASGTVKNADAENMAQYIDKDSEYNAETGAITKKSTAVAKIGKTEYETLKEAINAATTGDTITLLQNVNLGSKSIGFYNSKSTNLTIDLGGHKITSAVDANGTVIVSKDGLVIKNGTIENTSSNTKDKTSAVYVTNGGTTTLENVTLISKRSGLYVCQLQSTVKTVEVVVNVENGTVIEGGKYGIKLDAPEGTTSRIHKATLNVNGGNITGTIAGIHASSPAGGKTGVVDVQITAGTVSGVTVVTNNTSYPVKATVTGGTIEGNLTSSGANNISISGGNFTGEITQPGTPAGSITITGGKFTTADVSSYVPAGYEYDSATGEVKQAAEPTGVAKIGDTGYETLAEAVKNAKAGDTIVLLNDINLTSYQTIGKQLTIDLNGKTITSAAINTIKLTSNADLTVKDSGANGKITNEYKGSSYPATIYLKTAGTTFTLESGTIESDPNKTSLQSVAINSEKVACTVNISGGSVTVPEAATEGRGIVAGKGMTLNISGGTITGGLHGVDAYGGSTTNITGGTISARIVDTGVIEEAYGMRIKGTANVTVDGGEITGVKMDDNGFMQDVPNVTLKSGKINGSFYSITKGTITFTVDDNATITFANDTAKKFLPDTVELVQNEDGSYGVKAAVAKVAKIGDKYYPTLADAIAAAEDGDTITLLMDCSGNGIVVESGTFITKGLTVDFAGHAYTVGGVLVGSSGTKSNGFQLNKNNKITFQNGAIYGDASVAGDNQTNWTGAPAILIQNYCDLSLSGMNVSGGSNTVYTLSNNCGDVVIENTTIKAGGGVSGRAPFALDACGYSDYTGVSVTVKGTSAINGDIEVSRSSNNKNAVTLNLESGAINGKLKIDSSIKSGDTTTVTKSTNVTLAAPDGYLWNADGKLVVAVAQVGAVKYESLQAAIDAAKRNATVTMLADTKENVTISTPYLTLDLNGYTLNGGTEKGKPALTITARVTVKDSSELQNGTIMREDTDKNSGVSSHYVIDIQGSGWLTFEGGNVKNNSGNTEGKGASLVRVGNDSVAKYPGLNIKGGTFTQDNFIVIKVDRGDLFLNGGTLNSTDSYAIEDWHRATIKGGTVNGTVAAWTYSGGHNSDLSISGGTVNGNVASVSYDKAEGKLAKVSITGGTVTGELGTYTYNDGLKPMDDAAKATIKVTGGTFDKDPSTYVVEGSTVKTNSDGKYGVEKAYLAKVGETSYYTMDEAFKAQTASGEPIVMLRDYTTGSPFSSGSINRTVDLAGHTWICTGTDVNCAAFEINYPNVTLTVKNGTVVSGQLVGLIPSAMGGTITYDNAGLVFENVVMTTTAHSGIETNGNNTNDTVTLKNSTLNVPNGFGIYFPSSGTLTIDNSTINAKTMGVQVCAGSLNISGDQTAITVSGDGIAKTGNDGAIEDGAAISIVNRTGYKGLGDVTVTGGKFTAKAGNDAIKAYNWANNAVATFTANDKVAVSGGTFSSAVPAGLCATGYVPTEKGADGTYTVAVKEDVVAVIDKTEYTTLNEALMSAQTGETVVLMKDTTADIVMIRAGVTLNLYGHSVTNALLIYDNGQIIDTGDVKGIVQAEGYFMTTNEHTPVYDSTKNGYSFFDLRVGGGTKGNNAYLWLEGSEPDFSSAVALMKADTNGRRIKAVITFIWTDTVSHSEATQSYEFVDEYMSTYLENAASKSFFARVSGLDKFEGTVKAQAKFVITNESGVMLNELVGPEWTVKD